MMRNKSLNEKFRRTVKYWRVWFQQSSERDRLTLSLLAFLLVMYVWWLMIAL